MDSRMPWEVVTRSAAEAMKSSRGRCRSSVNGPSPRVFGAGPDRTWLSGSRNFTSDRAMRLSVADAKAGRRKFALCA